MNKNIDIIIPSKKKKKELHDWLSFICTQNFTEIWIFLKWLESNKWEWIESLCSFYYNNNNNK